MQAAEVEVWGVLGFKSTSWLLLHEVTFGCKTFILNRKNCFRCL